MDDDKGSSTDLLERPDSDDAGPSLGDRASGIGDGVRSAADSAKKVIGKASGGSGDGLGSSLAGGLSSLAGHGSAGNSIDGIKPKLPGVAGGDGADKTPGMFKGLEGGANPANKNDTSGDSENPSAKDFARKAGKNASQKVEQAAKDIAQTAKEVKHAATAVATLGANALDDAELAKDLAQAALHPIQTAKRYGRVALYLIGFFFIQTFIVFAAIGVIFFGIYKVYLMTMDIVNINPTDVVTELRVENEMASWLISSVGDLAYQRDIAAQRQPGVAVAQNRPNLPEPQSSPETSKMFQTWDNAGLAAKFMDEYHARFEPSNGSAAGDSTNPGNWDLIVGNKNFGNVNGTKARAFISIFADHTTHWRDIYTREALQGVATNSFDTQSFKLNLPDPEYNIGNSRVNTTKQLVSSTAKPITSKSITYYNCLIAGGDSCNSLGLGSTGSPTNVSTDASGGIVSTIISNLRNDIRTRVLQNTVGVEQIGQYASSTAEQVTPETSTYDTKRILSANIRTGSSDTILSNLPKDANGAPKNSALLDLYDRYRESVNNDNFSRVNYDRESRQSVALAENYFVAGGQLVNNEMGLLDSWALTENLSIVTQSPLFRRAVIGNPIGVFAEDEADDGVRSCQKIYNDLSPVGDISDNLDRDTTNNSCFRLALVPDKATVLSDRSANRIYNILEEKNEEVNKSNGVFSVGDALNAALQRYNNREIRSSPLATESIKVAQDLSPDFDGYTNNVYGVSKTGAEINGDAYDSMRLAAEALWTKALIDDQVGIGASYQTDEQTAEVMRYAQKIDREKMAFKPLGERLFSLKDSKSLTAKLAMMTPTNKKDGLKSTLALLKPSNLTSAVASRMVPSTFAQDTAPVNPLNAIRTGYALDDPSNRMSGDQIWQQYSCDSGGPTQSESQPNGVPFNIATNTNPCKREAVLSRITTCYFDTEDSCSMVGSGSTPTPAATTSGTVGDIGESSDSVPCAEGSNDIGNVESRYAGSLRKDIPLIIKLCQVPDIGGRGNDTSGNNIEGGIVVNSRVSGAWVALGRAAKSASPAINLTGSSFRLADSCGGGGDGSLCARPGTSMHQLGIAVDFSDMGSSGGSTSSCSGRKGARGDPRWDWLFSNAQNYGIKQYSYEPWHWDTNPGANRCDSSSPAVY
ncbi:D-alanyl-D-alanine carboxypeptidase family protein [Candidatus Nomurabacteria bacterium]|nr:D-alanyl-D-alanine carboxypeptidase family protein [Candidatus Nomurabacteria bacterium]